MNEWNCIMEEEIWNDEPDGYGHLLSTRIGTRFTMWRYGQVVKTWYEWYGHGRQPK